jgi:TonB family protein
MTMLNTILDVERRRGSVSRLADALEGPRLASGRFPPAAVCVLYAVVLNALFAQAALAQQNAPPQPDAVPPAATAPSPPAPTSSAAVSWERSLVARLVRFQRYPPRARGLEGVVSLAFSIDRHGNVVSSHIVKSSGSALLDYEALDLIKRAAPLPAPSTEIADSDLSVIVPIRFSAGDR